MSSLESNSQSNKMMSNPIFGNDFQFLPKLSRMNYTAGSLELIKRINHLLVLDTVKNCQPVSRAQIAKKLKLSKTTVLSITNHLIERKFIYELGESASAKGGGRPCMMLGFNQKSAYGVGVDIGGTKTLIIITDLAGDIVLMNKYKTTNKIEEIVGLTKACIQEANLNEKDIIGLGIAVPGTTMGGTVIQAKHLKWSNFDLQSSMQAYLSFPIFVNNDVKYALMGERWLGSGENSDNIFFIAIGTGIGSAILSEGNLVIGHDNRAGEICYQTSREDLANHRLNVWGKSSVFEEKVSGTALNRHNYPAETLFELGAKGSEEVRPILKNFIEDLSVVIANVVSLLNPEFVIIGGGVSESMGEVIGEIQEMVCELTPIKTKIRLATLGGKAGALGAIAYTLEQVEQT
jgi:glucokinase